MKKKTMPKWYEGAMTADVPVMKKDKMMYMHDDMHDDMDYEMNGGMMNGDMMHGKMMHGKKMHGKMMDGDMMDGDMMDGDMMHGDMMDGDMMDGDMMHGDMMDGDMMDGMPVKHDHHMPMQMMLAHAYVPWQCYDNAFSPCEALMKGTLFPELWGVYPIPE